MRLLSTAEAHRDQWPVAGSVYRRASAVRYSPRRPSGPSARQCRHPIDPSTSRVERRVVPAPHVSPLLQSDRCNPAGGSFMVLFSIYGTASHKSFVTALHRSHACVATDPSNRVRNGRGPARVLEMEGRVECAASSPCVFFSRSLSALPVVSLSLAGAVAGAIGIRTAVADGSGYVTDEVGLTGPRGVDDTRYRPD